VVNRIKELATHFNLSSTGFADRIEVARPVISHILSERNRPSLEVIQKIGQAFPDLSLDWLLYGKGEMLKPLGNLAESNSVKSAIVSEEKTEDFPTTAPESNNLSTNQGVQSISSSELLSKGKRITKVLFFYNDNTFEEFNPGK
jgi:transcriptional regulator with XRE-family HTH domain